MKRVVIVDDSVSYGDLWSNFILERYPDTVKVETYRPSVRRAAEDRRRRSTS